MVTKVLILIVNLLIFVAAQDLDYGTTEENVIDNNIIDPLEITEELYPLNVIDPLAQELENVPKDFIISWQARRALRRILAQMPCGWPEYGVPPLAPYETEALSFKLENSVFKTDTNLKALRIDGLNNMEINRLKIGFIIKRVNFDFNFPNITVTGNFDTTTTLNLEKYFDQKFFLKGGGNLKLTLENLRVSGNLKYKLPIFFGSAKIQKVNAQVNLGDVSSEMSGFINGIPIGGTINDFIVTKLLKYLNEHDFFWNGLIEKHVLPVINSQLEGKTLWKIFWWSVSRSEYTCTPELLTDMDILEFHQLVLKDRKPLSRRLDDEECW